MKRLWPKAVMYGLVAKDEKGDVCGFAYFQYMKRLAPGRYLASMGIFVVDRLQGQGIGSSLVRTLMESAKARGIAVMKLTVGIDNERAIRVYEEHGFQVVKRIPRSDSWGDNCFDVYEMEVVLEKI